MRGRLLVITASLLLCAAGSASAQVLQPPPRLYRGLFGGGRPPDPNRTHQELALDGNLLGGYDDNLNTPTSQPYTSNPSGYIGFSDASLRYAIGHATRSLQVRTRGYMNTYRNVGMTPSYGGDETLHATTTFGRQNTLDLDQSVHYAPYFALGLFGPLQTTPGFEAPDKNPTYGLAEIGSWTASANLRSSRQWSRGTKTNIAYAFSQTTYADKLAFDSRMHEGSIGIDQSISRAVGLVATYRRNDSAYSQSDGTDMPLVNDTAEAGMRYTRRVSRTRQISFSAGGGAVHSDTVDVVTRQPATFVTPMGYGTMNIDVGRSWNLSGDYRRSVSTLQGVVPAAFVTDAATVSAGGYTSRIVETVLSVGWSNGATGQATDGELGRFDGYTGTLQFRFRISRFWSALASGNHYQYRLNTAASTMLRVAPEMHRNSIRIGVAWSLPLAGSYLSSPPAAGKD
jgi:hypothetical protein